MKIPFVIGAVAFGIGVMIAPVSAIACPVTQAPLFLGRQVQFLPQGAVQIQVVVEDDPKSVASFMLRETNSIVSNVVNGDVPYRRIKILLETEEDSCSIIGLPKAESFLVGFFERDPNGVVRQSADGLPIFKPISYFPHRSPDDERHLAGQIDCSRNGGEWDWRKKSCELVK